MKNKIKELTYFIFFTVLLGIYTGCYASTQEPTKISAKLTQSYYAPTLEIEKLFKEKLNLDQSVIYTKVPRGLIVSISSSVFFEDGQDELLETSKPILHKIGELLNNLHNKCIVEGNTEHDTYKKSEYKTNWELSTIRSDKIVEYLIKTENVHPKKIDAVGFGEIMPFKNNVSYKGNMNNRIDFVIINYEQIKPLD